MLQAYVVCVSDVQALVCYVSIGWDIVIVYLNFIIVFLNVAVIYRDVACCDRNLNRHIMVMLQRSPHWHADGRYVHLDRPDASIPACLRTLVVVKT